MKVWCPNCEKDTECELPVEVYICGECNEDFADYETPYTEFLLDLINELYLLLDNSQAKEMADKIIEAHIGRKL